MKTGQTVYIGVDVAKETLSINAGEFFVGDIQNKPADIRKTLAKIARKAGQDAVLHVCYETTGRYGDALRDTCFKKDVRVSVLNPLKVRQFAAAMSQTAKTDRIDADVIRRFAQVKTPDPAVAPDANLAALHDLVAQREAFCDTLTRLRNMSADTTGGRLIAQTIRHLEAQIAKADKQIAQLIASDAKLSGLSAGLCAIQGVGPTTAAKLLAFAPELGTLGRSRAASLAGLAPRTRESGRFKGKATTGGGRPALRTALYMSALVASRHNPVLCVVYNRLSANGKRPKVALTAVMRKLFIHMDRVAARWLKANTSTIPA